MNNKSIVLMVGAIAAGMQAASQKSQNPTVTMVLVFAAVALSFFADPPRDPNSFDRISDRPQHIPKVESNKVESDESPLAEGRGQNNISGHNNIHSNTENKIQSEDESK